MATTSEDTNINKRQKMDMFHLGGAALSSFGATVAEATTNTNPNKDFEVICPPEDSTSALEFSPPTVPQNYLIGGSWDCQVRCWEVEMTGRTIPKVVQTMGGPVLDVCWHDDGTKVFMASTDKTAKCWDLNSNQTTQAASHEAPIKTCHWIKGSNYNCLMTGSWDKTLKFWDMRSPRPIMTINLPERCYCAHVDYPMAVVGMANRLLTIYKLEGTPPQEYKRVESPLKHQHRSIAIFNDMKTKQPTGFALCGVAGRVAIYYVNPVTLKDTFTFMCHRSTRQILYPQHVYAVNDIAVHPVHGTLATVGSDGTFAFWDKNSRTRLMSSKQLDQSITKCAFNHSGHMFAYAVSYDWSKGHEHFNPAKKNSIFFRSCFDELKPRTT